MKSKFLEVYQHAIVYGLGNAGQQLISFILLPLYTSYLAPDEYGRLALITALSGLLSVLLGMGFATSFFKFYPKAGEIDSKKEVISSALVWLFGVGIMAVIVLWLMAGSIAKVFLGSLNYSLYIKIMAVNLMFNMLQLIPAGMFRAEKRSWQYVVFTLSDLILALGLNIYFLTSLRMGVLGILLADALATGIMLLVELYVFRHMLQLALSWSLIGSMLRFGSPLILSGLGIYILNQADRWFLQYYTTMEVVGVYSLGYKFALLINLLLIQPIQLVWIPMVFEMEKHPDAKQFYERMLTYVFLINLWVALGLSIFSKEVIALMTTPAYHSAYKVVPWVALAYVIYGAYPIVNIGTLLSGKTVYSIWIVGIAGLSNLLLNFFLIPSWGGLGAAQATLLSEIILFAIAWWINRRILSLQYQWGRILKVFLVFMALLMCGQMTLHNLYLDILLKSSLMIIYFGLLWLWSFYEAGEIGWVGSVLRKYLRLTP